MLISRFRGGGFAVFRHLPMLDLVIRGLVLGCLCCLKTCAISNSLQGGRLPIDWGSTVPVSAGYAPSVQGYEDFCLNSISAPLAQGTPYWSKGMRSSDLILMKFYHRPISPGYVLLVQGYEEICFNFIVAPLVQGTPH